MKHDFCALLTKLVNCPHRYPLKRGHSVDITVGLPILFENREHWKMLTQADNAGNDPETAPFKIIKLTKWPIQRLLRLFGCPFNCCLFYSILSGDRYSKISCFSDHFSHRKRIYSDLPKQPSDLLCKKLSFAIHCDHFLTLALLKSFGNSELISSLVSSLPIAFLRDKDPMPLLI